MRKLVVVAVALGAFWLVPSASAAIPSVFDGDVACSVDGDGTRECGSSAPRSVTDETFDNVPLDVNVAFPPEPMAGPDGNFPLLVWGHGYGGSKLGFGTNGQTNGMRRFTSRGYAVMSMTTRGFHESCGSDSARTALGAVCDDVYVRLMDTRYEVRDYQELAAVLSDEDLIDPQRIGALGGSYGGGLSMALAALKNRKMLPDSSLVPWVSPVDGESLQIAGAVPSIPWTDLSYSLVPNGRTLDYVTDAGYSGPVGVMKQSLVNGLYVSGDAAGTYAAPGSDPDADLSGWLTRLEAGEPYTEPYVLDVLAEIQMHHSSYYINDSTSPAPLLISSGFTDDLFPADEAVRFYHRTRETHPSTPISLFFGNFGHQRAANRAADGAVLVAREDAWLDFYVKGTGATPFQGVESTTQVCPNTSPSEGPFAAANWARSASGEVRHTDNSVRTIAAGAGDTAIAQGFNPTTEGNNPCDRQSGADQAGAANYRLPAAPGAGYVLLGSPTVIATIGSPGANNQIAARLLDVAPDGQETLVSRGLYRPDQGTSRQVFQLHPNGWRFAPGHIPKLELLPKDAGVSPLVNYGRASNGQTDVTVDDLQLRLPVMSKPGALGGAVGARARFIVPAGEKLAKDFADLGVINATVRKGKLKADDDSINGLKAGAPQDWEAAHVTVQVLGGKGKTKKSAKKKTKKKKGKPLAKGKATIAGGKVGKVTLKLTKKGKRKLADRKGKLKVKVVLTTTEQEGKVKVKRTLRLG